MISDLGVIVSTPNHLDDPVAPGRRERKKNETRDRILECAVSLFATRGYDSTTMEDIGECADVARATVFNYFTRKEDLVFEWFDRRRADLANVLADAGQESIAASDRLRQAFGVLARLYEDDAPTGRAMVRAWLQAGGPLLANQSGTAALLADTIRSGQHESDLPPDIDADRAGLVLFDAYLGALYRWVRDEEAQHAFAETLTATVELVLSGIDREASKPAPRRRTGQRAARPSR